ncbi:AAA family ATPase, partial [Enterococcus faecium]
MVRKLKKLSMKTEWNQFDKLEIRFHDRVTILTGKNGVGKTSLLRMISRTAYSDQQKELWSGFLEDKDKETINVLKILKNEMPYLFVGTNPAIPKNLVNSLKTRNQNSKENNDNFSTICTIEFSDAKIKLDLPINTNASKEWDYDFDLQIKKSGEEWQYFQPKYSYGNVNIDSYDPGISINS